MNESQLGEDEGQCINAPTPTVTSPENSVKNDKKKKVYNGIFLDFIDNLLYIYK